MLSSGYVQVINSDFFLYIDRDASSNLNICEEKKIVQHHMMIDHRPSDE